MVLLYGELTKIELEVIQNRACRCFLGVTRNASNIATRGDMGWHSVHTKQKIEVLRMFFKLHHIDDDPIDKKVFIGCHNKANSWSNRVFRIFNSLNVCDSNFNFLSIKQKVNVVKEKLYEVDNNLWYKELFHDNGNKLRTYRTFKTVLNTSEYVKNVKYRDRRKILANFRCGCLPLAIKLGRYARPKIALCDRLCKFCDSNKVESEQHFLMECDFYSEIRYDIFTFRQQLNPFF